MALKKLDTAPILTNPVITIILASEDFENDFKTKIEVSYDKDRIVLYLTQFSKGGKSVLPYELPLKKVFPINVCRKLNKALFQEVNLAKEIDLAKNPKTLYSIYVKEGEWKCACVSENSKESAKLVGDLQKLLVSYIVYPTPLYDNKVYSLVDATGQLQILTMINSSLDKIIKQGSR